MMPIFQLTLHQLIRRRRYIIVLLVSALPVLLSAFYWWADGPGRPRIDEFHDVVTATLLVAVVLPITSLLLSTATLGDEVEDETLVYLVLKPIARWRIVAPKLVATILGVAVPVSVSGIISSLLITEGDLATSLVTAIGLSAGAAAYCTVFTWGGLVSRQAIIFGLGYVFLWEVSITELFSGLRFISIRQYTLSVIQGLDDQRLQIRDAGGAVDLELVPALVGVVVIVLLFGWLTERRLRLMDIP
jgi:ABC-2 type transport system permease protein